MVLSSLFFPPYWNTLLDFKNLPFQSFLQIWIFSFLLVSAMEVTSQTHCYIYFEKKKGMILNVHRSVFTVKNFKTMRKKKTQKVY